MGIVRTKAVQLREIGIILPSQYLVISRQSKNARENGKRRELDAKSEWFVYFDERLVGKTLSGRDQRSEIEYHNTYCSLLFGWTMDSPSWGKDEYI